MLVGEVTRRLALPQMEAIRMVLSKTDWSRLAKSDGPTTRRLPHTLALTPWQRHMLTPNDIEAALRAFLVEDRTSA
jgi:hypothetical protein